MVSTIKINEKPFRKKMKSPFLVVNDGGEANQKLTFSPRIIDVCEEKMIFPSVRVRFFTGKLNLNCLDRYSAPTHLLVFGYEILRFSRAATLLLDPKSVSVRMNLVLGKLTA